MIKSHPELVCLITLDICKYAIKLNNNYYELDDLCDYLASEFEKPDLKKASDVKCPMRGELPKIMIYAIAIYHFEVKKGTEISKSSLQICLWEQSEKDQKEYNSLIISYRDSSL